jgi:hypothetical protein
MIECFHFPDVDQAMSHSQAESKMLTSLIVLIRNGEFIVFPTFIL